MEEVLPRLGKPDFVERYPWFTSPSDHPRFGPSALFDQDGNLTALGEFFADHQD